MLLLSELGQDALKSIWIHQSVLGSLELPRSGPGAVRIWITRADQCSTNLPEFLQVGEQFQEILHP